MMFMKIGKYFANGLLIIAPILLTVWIVTTVFWFLNGLTGHLAEYAPVLQKYLDIPGVGIVISILLIILIGYIASIWLIRSFFSFIDMLIRKIPGVKTLYNLIKETLASFVGKNRSFSKVVAVTIPGTNMKLLGFVTAESCSRVGFPGHTGVYILQSMQWAGHTLLIPNEDIEILDVSSEEVMKFIVSAGIAGGNDPLEPEPNGVAEVGK